MAHGGFFFLDNFGEMWQSMVRKEKYHLTKFRGRVRELEAQANQTEALLSGVKEDKVRN